MRSDSYIPSSGPFHRFDVRAKLVFTILMMVSIFLMPTIPWLYALVFLVFMVEALENGPSRAFGDVAIIAPMIAVMLIFMPLNARDGEPLVQIASFTLVTRQALDGFLVVAGRFLGISLVCSLMMHTTRSFEVLLALSWFHLPQGAGVVISLAMRFIPDMAATFRQIRESQRLRLPDPDEKDTRHRPLSSVFPTLVSLIVGALRMIPTSAAAIDLRGYGRANRRTSYRRLETTGMALALHFLVALLVPALLVALPRIA